MNWIKESMAATYVQIGREDLENWLDSLRLPMRWKRQENRAGIYLLPLSPVVAIKLSSTIGSRDDALGVGKASMQLALVSTVTGKTINKKAQEQSHFKRTTGWRTTWEEGIERMRAAYMKSQGFYDALAVIEDREQYQQDTLSKIEDIPNWEQNSMLSDFHFNVAKGGILTTKQMAALNSIARRGGGFSQRPQGDDPGEFTRQPPVVDEELIERVRNLYRQAHKLGDAWLLDFATNVGKALKDGRPLSPKQTEFLEKNFAKYRLASSRSRVASRIAARYMRR